VYIQDPRTLVAHSWGGSALEYPKTIYAVNCTLDRQWNTILNDHSAPLSRLWDTAISECTMDPIIAMELRGGRGDFTEFNCAHCSHGLGLTGCRGCGYKFKDDHFRCGWYTPLPQKIIRFVEVAGHKFGKNPELARAAEEASWFTHNT